MDSHYITVMLPLLLLLLAAFANAHSRLESYKEFQNFLQDPVSRQHLFNAFRGPKHPLELALDAAKASGVVPHICDSLTHININSSALPAEEKSMCECCADLLSLYSSPDETIFAAMTMLDASVKIPEGLLAFSLTHLGNWDECVGVRDVPGRPFEKEGRTFHGQMCIVSYVPVVNGKKQTREVPIPRDVEGEMGLFAALALRLSYCVPSSCKASHVQTIFSSYAKWLTADLPIQLDAVVTDNDCSTQDKRPLDGHDWAGISVFIALGVIVIASTTYDVVVPTTRKMPLLVAFSVISNGKKLLAGPRSGGDQALSSLHGIRFLSMLWVVMGHRYMYSVVMPSLNPMFIMDFFDKWYYIGIANATVSVDTFFVLSGLLVTYLFFKQEPSKRHLNVPMYYLHRYIRLTPALALMVLVNATFLSRVGNGPLWTASLVEAQDACKANWWNVLLYVANYVDPARQCVGQSWYLMVDMQLHWLSPLLLIPIAKYPRFGKFFIYPLIVAGLIINFVISYINDYPGNMMTINDPDKSAHFFRNFYIPTYTRYVPYVIGMLFGLILAEQRTDGKKPEPLSLVRAAFGWLYVAALMLVPLFTGLCFLKEPFPSTALAALYNSLHRPAWGLGVAVVVFLCANGAGGPVNAFLSWKGFQFLGRFSYCIYLVHITVQIVQSGTMRSPAYLSDGEILTRLAGDFLIAILFAGVLSVLTESPFLVLEKQLLGGKNRPQNTRSVNDPLPTLQSPPASQEDRIPPEKSLQLRA